MLSHFLLYNKYKIDLWVFFLVSAVLSVSFLSLLIFLTHLPTSLPLWQRIKQLLWTGLGSVFATYNRRNHIIWMWWSMMIEILVHAVNSFQEIPLPFWFANAQSLHLETSWSVYCGYGFFENKFKFVWHLIDQCVGKVEFSFSIVFLFFSIAILSINECNL